MQRPSAAGTPQTVIRNVTCPFCALLCDDLTLERHGRAFRVRNTDCPKAAAGFAAPVPQAEPRISGRPVDLPTAIEAAAAILREARAPLFAGLGTDVAGMRAAVALAERTGAVLDHLHGDALARNYASLHDNGWMTTTLAEVANRADLLLFAGTDARAYPRFFQRFVWNAHAMFLRQPRQREIVLIGRALAPPRVAGVRRPRLIDCRPERLGEVVDALRTRLAGRRLAAPAAAGVPLGEIDRLAERLRAARYSVVVWSPAALDYAHAELTVQSLVALVRELNETTRCAGLSLGGDEGGATAAAVCTWLTGYPLRVGFASGAPVYDPLGHATARLLADGRADALLWLSSFAPHPPPAARVPRVVLAHAALSPRPAPEVLIPVGTPGIDHPGNLFRCDSVVALPLDGLRAGDAPSAASVLTAIERAL